MSTTVIPRGSRWKMNATGELHTVVDILPVKSGCEITAWGFEVNTWRGMVTQFVKLFTRIA